MRVSDKIRVIVFGNSAALLSVKQGEQIISLYLWDIPTHLSSGTPISLLW
jgi:hypothetical protein